MPDNGFTKVQISRLQKDKFTSRTWWVDAERLGRSRRVMNRKRLKRDPKIVNDSCEKTRKPVSSSFMLVIVY